MSPNYPNPYPHNGVCVWAITVHRRARITFTVTDMDLEMHRNCGWDYIEVLLATACHTPANRQRSLATTK